MAGGHSCGCPLAFLIANRLRILLLNLNRVGACPVDIIFFVLWADGGNRQRAGRCSRIYQEKAAVLFV